MKKTRLDDIMAEIRALWKTAQKDWECVYEWHMGVAIVEALDAGCQLLRNAKGEKITCYGYPVRICMEDSERLELWRKIE